MSTRRAVQELSAVAWRGWFAECDQEFRRALLKLARRRSHPAQTVIYRAEEESHELFGVVSGYVEVQARVPHADAVFTHLIHAGHWFGAAPMTAGRPRRVTALSRTDVQLIYVVAEDLRDVLERHPAWWQQLGREVVYALDVMLQIASDLLIPDTTARCATVLLRFADRRSAHLKRFSTPSEIPATQTELAMACNVSRNTFNEVLRRFESAGWVQIGYRSIRVTDPAALLRLVEHR